MSKQKFAVQYATDSGNLADLANTYTTEERAMIAARNMADALKTTCTVDRVETSFGICVRHRVAVIVNTDKFNFEASA